MQRGIIDQQPCKSHIAETPVNTRNARLLKTLVEARQVFRISNLRRP